MAFTNYKSVADVARPFQIYFQRGNFLTPSPVNISQHFREELDFTLREVPFDGSESAACETLIYPFLREVWRTYLDTLTLWSHPSITYNTDLSAVPDYLVARRSDLGPLILDQPYLLIVEAKQDNFTQGWGQCLAAMLAAQKLHDVAEHVVYGVTTNGQIWQFGKLEHDKFTQDSRSFTLEDVDNLGAAIHYTFEQCRDQLMQSNT